MCAFCLFTQTHTLKVFASMCAISNDSFLYHFFSFFFSRSMPLSSFLVVFMLFRFISSVYLCFLCLRFLVSYFFFIFSFYSRSPHWQLYWNLFGIISTLICIYDITALYCYRPSKKMSLLLLFFGENFAILLLVKWKIKLNIKKNSVWSLK